jgi:hypothetical protein
MFPFHFCFFTFLKMFAQKKRPVNSDSKAHPSIMIYWQLVSTIICNVPMNPKHMAIGFNVVFSIL